MWRVHSSRLPHSRPVLVLSRSSWRHVGKSVPSQRKRECPKCLAILSMILTQECECLHLCVLRLVHISPKVATDTWDENLNQALGIIDYFPSLSHIFSTCSRLVAFEKMTVNCTRVKGYKCLASLLKLGHLYSRSVLEYYNFHPGKN